MQLPLKAAVVGQLSAYLDAVGYCSKESDLTPLPAPLTHTLCLPGGPSNGESFLRQYCRRRDLGVEGRSPCVAVSPNPG